MSADLATATAGLLGLSCPWCDQPFEAKLIGAHKKRFCSPECKGAFHTALRKWGQQALNDGHISITDLRSG